MTRTLFLGRPILFLLLVALPNFARAQIVVIDDVILMTSRQKKQQESRSHQHLDPPGGENLLAPSPGADLPRLGEERTLPLFPSPLSRRAKRRGQRGRDTRLHVSAPPGVPSEDGSLTGPLEIPTEESEEEGLSLDAALDRLLAANSDLAAKYYDIPKARADILTAGLRSNPFLFLSISDIPYGHYSPQRPGATLYDLTVIQPLDINDKRDWRIHAAQEAKGVLEAQYQDAVRQTVDRLHNTFVNVLEARQAVAALQAGLAHLSALDRQLRQRAARGSDDAAELAVEKVSAEVALQRAQTTLLQSRRELALLLNVPAECADSLPVVGSLKDCSPAPPCEAELIAIALHHRPDLAAYRLGSERARADFRRERAEAIDNVFLFYTPFTAQDFSPQGKQSPSGWGLGFLFSLPLFDRNQGDIARARVNVTQTDIEREGLERRIVNEVLYAATEYTLSRDVVRQYEQEILASARGLRAETERQLLAGQAKLDAFLEAQKEYDEVVRDYLEALVYHRRCMLRLNIAVGQRIFP